MVVATESHSPPGDPQESSSFLLKAIDRLAPDPEKVSAWVESLRAKNEGITNDGLARYVTRHVRRVFTGQGAALALPGAIPGLGTMVQLGTEVGMASTDVALMLRHQTYLVFAIGHCYGITDRDILIQDTLLCIGLWTNALSLTRGGEIRMGDEVVDANFHRHFPARVLQLLNKKVGTAIITKYGTKRGGVAIGKLIPFGVGVAVGGGFNYVTMTRFSSRATTYLSTKA